MREQNYWTDNAEWVLWDGGQDLEEGPTSRDERGWSLEGLQRHSSCAGDWYRCKDIVVDTKWEQHQTEGRWQWWAEHLGQIPGTSQSRKVQSQASGRSTFSSLEWRKFVYSLRCECYQEWWFGFITRHQVSRQPCRPASNEKQRWGRAGTHPLMNNDQGLMSFQHTVWRLH